MDLNYLAISLAILISTALARSKSAIPYLLAIICWFTSEVATNLNFSGWSSAGYVAFYPLVFLAIPGLFEINLSGSLVSLLDGAILVLGSSTIATVLLIRNFRSDFLHLIYAICDMIVLIAVLMTFVRRQINTKSFLVLMGFLIYTITDFIYLYEFNDGNYFQSSLLNYGWLLGFAIITAALFRKVVEIEEFPPIPIFYLALSFIGSSLILTAIALALFGIPNYVIAPALATLFASFIRMALTLRQSEKNHAEQSLSKIDDLTGLPNRRRFISEIEKFQNGSILLMDLDGFKKVNDNHGHEIGDEILKQVSNRFQRALPEHSLLARLGGDEFAVLTNGNYEAAMELAMALRATLSYPFNIAGEQINVDVSIGCVANDGKTDLMSRADTAMYQAKKARVGVWAGGS
jgi:diguanylate cyclase (GGDEF)-like protein